MGILQMDTPMLVLRRVAKVDGKSDLATRREVVGWDQCWKSGPCFIANSRSLDKAILNLKFAKGLYVQDVFKRKNICFTSLFHIICFFS